MFDSVFTFVARLRGGADDDADPQPYRIDTRPTTADEHVSLARDLATAGEPWRAAHHFNQAIEKDQGNADAHRGYASLLSEQGYLESAERHYQRALELATDPDWEAEYESLLERKGTARPPDRNRGRVARAD